MQGRRKWLALVVVLLMLVVGWLWQRGRSRAAWSVSIQAGKTVLEPWEGLALEGLVTGGPAGLVFSWETASAQLDASGAKAHFRTGRVGQHPVRLRVSDGRGHERQASVTLEVRAPEAVEVPSAHAMGEPPAKDQPFAIADITVDKSSICRGEQTIIRVRPRHDNAAEAGWLTPMIGYDRGWQVPYQDFHSPPGRYQIPVRLLAPRTLDQEERAYVEERVFIEIRDCLPPWILLLSDRVLASEGNVSHELRATLRPGRDFGEQPIHPAQPADAADAGMLRVSYVWDFDDGQQATTRDPIIHHDFPAEDTRSPDDGAEHTYLVRVRAVRATGGELATAVKEINLPNMYADLKRIGHRLQLEVHHDPLPTTLGEDQVLALQLRNIDRVETVTISALALRKIGCDGSDQGVEQVAPGSMLKGLVLPPKGTTTGEMKWPVKAGTNICFVNANLTGTSQPGGYEVVGYWSMPVGKDPAAVKLSKDRTAVLNTAMRLLGNPRTLTLRDIQRLEDEGKIPRGMIAPPPDPAPRPEPPAPGKHP